MLDWTMRTVARKRKHKSIPHMKTKLHTVSSTLDIYVYKGTLSNESVGQRESPPTRANAETSA